MTDLVAPVAVSVICVTALLLIPWRRRPPRRAETTRDDGIVPVQEREEYFAWSQTRAARARQLLAALRCRAGRSTKRWFGVSGWAFFLKLLFWLAVLLAVGKIGFEVWRKWWVSAPDVDLTSFLVEISTPVAAFFIWIYQAGVAYKIRARPEEMARRDVVSSLVREIISHCGRAWVPEEREARLREICDCVRLDLQEHLEITEHDLQVVLLELCDHDAATHAGTLRSVTRTRPSAGGWSSEPRPVLASYAYEAIRQERAVIFGDLRNRRLRRLFGKPSGEYRTLLCLPIVRPNSELQEPIGILTVNMKRPYQLGLHEPEVLTKRLRPYIEFATLFMGARGGNSRLETADEPDPRRESKG